MLLLSIDNLLSLCYYESMNSNTKYSDSNKTRSELDKFKLGFEFDVLEKDIKKEIKRQIIRKPPTTE